MAPRTVDTSGNYKSNCSERCDSDFVPELLHKKHKVVKLVQQQLQKLRTEGFTCCPDKSGSSGGGRFLGLGQGQGYGQGQAHERGQGLFGFGSGAASGRSGGGRLSELGLMSLLWGFLILLTILYIITWMTAGPLSNRIPHTPLSLWHTFIRTDKSAKMEEKSCQRWCAAACSDD